MMIGKLLSFWDGIFSGAMLNFQGVDDIDILGGGFKYFLISPLFGEDSHFD